MAAKSDFASKIILLSSAFAVIAYVANVFYDAGEFYELESVKLNCEKVHTDRKGFEDFANFHDGSMATFDSDHAHFQFTFGKTMRERIQESMRRGVETPQLLLIAEGGIEMFPTLKGTPREFFPHGLAGFGTIDDDAMLLVVNHRTDFDTLDIFRVTSKDATLETTVQHPLLFNVNDCVFASRNEVYCTNWRSYQTGTLMDAIEVYGQMPWNNVVRCHIDTSICEEVYYGIPMANGIEISNDKSEVYVVSSTSKTLRVFKRNLKTGKLSYEKSIASYAACDNLAWHGQYLLSGCHPKLLTLAAHTHEPSKLFAPCEVMRFNLLTNTAETLYLDPTGEEFSGCSVARILDDSLWVGSIHGYGLLKCQTSNLIPKNPKSLRRLSFKSFFSTRT